MGILRFLKRLVNDASDMDGYAILIIALIILRIISYFRRRHTESINEDLRKEKQEFEGKIKTSEAEKHKLKNDIIQIRKKADSDLKQSHDKIKTYQEKESQFINQIAEFKNEFEIIREKYSSSYEQLLHSKESHRDAETRLHSYRLSPHFLKNLINKAFIESKLSFDENDIKTSFSVLGKKFSTKENLIKQLNVYNEKLDKSLLLLIDTLNYLLYSTSAKKVHLQTEISQLEMFCQLIEMHKDIKVEISKNFDDKDFYIPPTILFNYIENAITHGYFKGKPLQIHLSSQNNIFDYTVTTPLHPEMNSDKVLGGIGNNDFESSLKRNTDTYELKNEIINNTYVAKLKVKI